MNLHVKQRSIENLLYQHRNQEEIIQNIIAMKCNKNEAKTSVKQLEESISSSGQEDVLICSEIVWNYLCSQEASYFGQLFT